MASIKLQWKAPSNYIYYLKAYNKQKQAAKKRQFYKQRGLHIPPIMIISITNRCNLNCKGCYANAQIRNENEELSKDELQNIFSQAEDLGTSIIMLAGGEPLMRPEILETAAKFKNILFPVFTNSTLIDESYLRFFKTNKNIIPILSMEGHQNQTDDRRGAGIFNTIIEKAENLNSNNIHFGASLTLTSQNYNIILKDEYIESLVEKGSKLTFFVEYVPQSEKELELCITPDQKANLSAKLKSYENKYGGMFTALPGDEEQYGGCLAAGRGFIHISSSGDVEPCPFTPYSDCNLKDITLEKALESGFLKKLRDNHDKLSESLGGCTLWENKAWVEKQLN